MVYRSYCANLDLNQKQLTITDSKEIHHIKNVLRLQQGEEILVFDGQGNECQGRVESIMPRAIEVIALEIRRGASKTAPVILACAIPKQGKFELIVEKATELGADEIIPLMTARTEIILKGDAIEKKRERFVAVAVSASKQCGRSSIPVIHPPMKLKAALEMLKPKVALIIPSLMGDRKILADVLKEEASKSGMAFFIGPEGDFTKEEYQLAWNSGCIPVTLGESVLRVETAAIAVMAAARLIN